MAHNEPDKPKAPLSRQETADFLTSRGYPIKPATLATKASRGDGPPFRSFGKTPCYDPDQALAWAQSRLSPPRGSKEIKVMSSSAVP